MSSGTGERIPENRDVGMAADSAPAPMTLLVVGDLYFTKSLMTSWKGDPGIRLLTEPWNQRGPVEPLSQDLRDSADIILCDWCKEYAIEYSKSKRSEQKLIVRMIMYDTTSELSTRVDWDQVDHIVYIIPDLARRFRRRNPDVTVPNTVIRLGFDTAPYRIPKVPGADRTMGMLGFYEERKGPDLAVTMLEAGLEADDSYHLSFKGQHPWLREYVWKRRSSRQYTADLYRRIMGSPAYARIDFARHSPEVAEWFTRIGIILSASRDESCHLAVAEGMASGAVPIVRNWPDADWMYPAPFVLPFEEEAFLDAAIAFMTELHDPQVFRVRSMQASEYAETYFSIRQIRKEWDELFAQLLV